MVTAPLEPIEVVDIEGEAVGPSKLSPEQETDKEKENRRLRNEQMHRVIHLIEKSGFLPTDLVNNEVCWFYENLGIDDIYFANESDDVIASHVLALYAAKLNAFIDNKDELEINLVRETENNAVYMHTSKSKARLGDTYACERVIDEKYLDVSCPKRAFRLETYRSGGSISSKHDAGLRCYFVTLCSFRVPACQLESNCFDITAVSDSSFLDKASYKTLEIYQKMIINIMQREGPVIEIYDTIIPNEKRLVIGFKQQTTRGFFSSLSDLCHFYGLYATKKYVEQFSNGTTIMSIYLSRIPTEEARYPSIDNSIMQIMKESSLIYCIPCNPLQDFFQQKLLSVQEMVYGYSAMVFAQHFLNRLGNEYVALQGILDPNNPAHTDVMTMLKKRLRQETFTREYVLDIVLLYPELIKMLYQHFGLKHYISSKDSTRLKPTLSFVRLHSEKIYSEAELQEQIMRITSNSHEQTVFEAFLTFNRMVLKTNFYQPTKVALSFRLDPSFLPLIEYPVPPYGLFLVIGSEFRGFHVRFQDISRGGVRIIKSRNKEAYSINFRGLFDENYSLASTQQRKNKDIPEGGAKGTILLDIDAQDKDQIAFEKYIDSMIDLLVVGDSPGIKEPLIDLYGKREMIFFGPDEGSALYMDWASQHAKARGVAYWKAFTTGKSSKTGGIPHDVFGMTTHSIHSYVLGIYRKLGLQEEEITKIQTGGPDGDLGSNEIKISNDKTIAIIDGSGVLYDIGNDGTKGIDRTELLRLANLRQSVCNFNREKLSKRGFLVLIEDHDIILPNGSIVEDGLKFRNEFHLSAFAVADLFVPCGGRPESVDVGNWHQLLHSDGSLKFKYIVEGANLFFTQESRLRLENAGCVIFKDASANKGGVTSSSLEVLASLALSDSEYEQLMTTTDSNSFEHEPANSMKFPKFYLDYVEAVHTVIEKNAELEFEAIWRENRKSSVPKSKYSDELSLAITKFDQELQCATLYENFKFRNIVLSEAIPPILVNKLGLDAIIQRLPEPYARAMFGSYLASRFIYQYGINASPLSFFEFVTKYLERI